MARSYVVEATACRVEKFAVFICVDGIHAEVAALGVFGPVVAALTDNVAMCSYAHVYFADESAAAAVLARGAVLVRGQACQCNPAPQRRAPLPRAAFVSDEARRRADGAAAAAVKEAAAAAGLAPGAVPRDLGFYDKWMARWR